MKTICGEGPGIGRILVLSLSCPAMSTHSMGVPVERMQALSQAGRCTAVGLGSAVFSFNV